LPGRTGYRPDAAARTAGTGEMAAKTGGAGSLFLD
jgi:hypothetical protein